MEIICILIFSIELLFAIVLQWAKSRLPKGSNEAPIQSISFIIPFHNEADRVLPLIQSINASKFLGKCEFIFVDDHSTDGTVDLLKAQLKVAYRYIQNQDKKGKKQAIHTGVLAAKHEFIVTWDADIHFKPDYIQNLFALPSADLIILPVKMQSVTLAGKLSSIEFSFIETFNLGFAHLSQPMACNGANLGFRKQTFLSLNKTRRDYNIPSGDDLFLLWEMQQHHKKIDSYKNATLAVTTDAPATFLAIIRQRQRWKGKMKIQSNFETIMPVILQFLVVVASICTLVLAINQPLYYLLFLIKILAELIASWAFIRQHFSHIIVLLIHQIWYPFYVLILFAVPLSKEKRWRQN